MKKPTSLLSLRRTLWLAPVLFFATALFAAKPVPAPAASVNAINATEMRMHLEFLSSPELGGRYTLSPNFGIAAKYLASRLKSYGYKGAGKDGSFLQPFEIISATQDPEKSKLSLTVGKETLEPKYGEFYSATRFTGTAQGGIVFVGYGISSAAQKHDDYAGLDVKGKIVLIASGTPTGIDDSKLEDSEEDEGAARAHGAVGILRIPSAQLARAMKNPQYKDFINRFPTNRLAAETPKLPTLRLAPELSDKLLAQLDLTTDKVNEATKSGAALAPKALDASANFTASVTETKAGTQNVVAVLEGTDPKLKNEYIALSAHYDHLNKNARTGEYYPGADDDGSGTTAVLNIAQAMAMKPPRRSVFVIFHAGEEMGLLGSKYNTDYAPAVPLQDLVVDLNIDMIGRSKAAGDKEKANEELTGPDSIYVIGADRISKELNSISEQTNARTVKMKFDYTLNDPKHPERIYYRSDHWNYAKHGVPIIFYFDGIHVDYHKPTDTVDKIDFEKMTKVGRLVYETGWAIANLDHRLKKD